MVNFCLRIIGIKLNLRRFCYKLIINFVYLFKGENPVGFKSYTQKRKE